MTVNLIQFFSPAKYLCNKKLFISKKSAPEKMHDFPKIYNRRPARLKMKQEMLDRTGTP